MKPKAGRFLEIPRNHFDQLSPQQMAVANAIAHRVRARDWLQRARAHPPGSPFRSTAVGFARAAHTAYRRDIARAITYSAQRMGGR